MGEILVANRKRIDYIDLLRVVAIFSVISFHYLYSAIARGRTPNVSFSPFSEWAKYGYLGVELFFMISGFVIVQSARDLTFRQFIIKRFFRLYPSYWLALLLIFAVTSFGFWKRPGPSAQELYFNLTMFPTAFGQSWLDAAHWFLARQLQFYVAISIVLLLRSGKHLGTIFTWWAIIGCAWYFLGIQTFHIWYLNGFFALITGGAIIGLIREFGFSRFRLIGLIASYLWAIDSRMSKVPWLNQNRGPGHSALIIGLVMTVIYLLMILTLVARIASWPIRGAAFAGTLSYPLYLVHDRMGGLVIAQFGTEGNKYYLYLLVVMIAITFAYLLLKIEKILMSPSTSRSKIAKT